LAWQKKQGSSIKVFFMKYHNIVRLQLILAGAISWQPTPAALADSTVSHSKFIGVYLSQQAGPSMNLSLGADGSATVTEDPGSGAITLFGHWVDTGGEVGVTFDAEQGKSTEPPMVFHPAHDGLQAVSWNHATWGKVEPPPMKKGSKVKQLYWLTTGP
jgi:hypothetical protein